MNSPKSSIVAFPKFVCLQEQVYSSNIQRKKAAPLSPASDGGAFHQHNLCRISAQKVASYDNTHLSAKCGEVSTLKEISQ